MSFFFTCVNRKARDTLLKAARDGRLASAFSEMRKAAEVSSEKCVAKRAVCHFEGKMNTTQYLAKVASLSLQCRYAIDEGHSCEKPWLAEGLNMKRQDCSRS